MSDEGSLAGRCGTCAYFHSVRHDPARNANVGECSNGTWPPVRPETSSCLDYVRTGTLANIRPNKARRSAAPQKSSSAFSASSATPTATRAPIEIEVDMDEATFRTVLREVIAEELGLAEAPIGERWRGGELVLKPGKEGLKETRIPLEKFFHKIVMVRDKLRVLEQKVNSASALAPEDKVTLQQYITACYGSLTTFNILFREDEDKFVGASGDKSE